MQKKPSMTPEQFAESARQALGARLKSVVLYGSAAAGDFIEGRSGYDLLVVVEPLGIDELNALIPSIAAWKADGHEAPQLMSSQELAASVDSFPIELADIRQARRVLAGDDLLGGLSISRQHLRLQVERELKGKLQVLRQKYVLTGGGAPAVAALMAGSLSTFLVLLRGVLRLYEDEPPAAKLEALQRLKDHIAFDPQPFIAVHELKGRVSRAGDTEIRSLMASYLAQIESIVQAVDRHNHP